MKRPDPRSIAWTMIVVGAASLFVSARAAVQIHNTLRAMDTAIHSELHEEPCR